MLTKTKIVIFSQHTHITEEFFSGVLQIEIAIYLILANYVTIYMVQYDTHKSKVNFTATQYDIV